MKLIQGDVILKRVDELPQGATKLEGTILQKSEVTGHHHYFKPLAPVKIYETKTIPAGNTITPDTGKFILVGQDAFLYHGIPAKDGEPKPTSWDHRPIEVPAGIYKVTIAREYDYDREEVTRVVD